MLNITDDVRIGGLRPLLPPAILMEEVPASHEGLALVANTRKAISHILNGSSDRLLVVVGPCSIHDPKAGLEYAAKLKEQTDELADELVVVMRTYFEKPRTTVGWKGLINDPRLDNSFAINQGLRIARGFLRDVLELGQPMGTEFLDPISPQFVADLVSWGAIGARTTESQVHRELASGLSMPVGFKNGTAGTIQIAIDAVRSSAHPHHFLSVTKQGLAAIVETRGNEDCHIILRGGHSGPNHSAEHVKNAVDAATEAGLPGRVMVDCSHANSGKDPLRQRAVAEALAQRIEKGNDHVFGVMLESFLKEGRQDLKPNARLEYGKSITDACMGWDQTRTLLGRFAAAVRARRQSGSSAN